MTLLDAYALVALIANEPAADEVEALLRRGEARIVVVNLAEAIDVLHRVHGLPAEAVREPLQPLLLRGVLAVRESSEAEAWLAAELRGQHYDRNSRPLSMADCLLLAAALATEDSVATADRPVAEVARAEGVDLVGLPDSSGIRPP